MFNLSKLILGTMLIMTTPFMAITWDELAARGDVPALVLKTKAAIKTNDWAVANEWLVKFTERVSIDYEFLSHEQQGKYFECFVSLDTQLEQKTFPKPLAWYKEEQRALAHKKATAWLKTIISDESITGLKYREYFAKSATLQSQPSPEELKSKRLNSLNDEVVLNFSTIKIKVIEDKQSSPN